ncbi:bifunctional diaminohydroxyphosphoribosylaminopyrimidine deaminase/5-amino-6-(5-phosphoribosylamino)uracil reductase RibD, partial [Planctomycetota bacterium]
AGSTMYVTLEPCCHKGKTGPCTDVIIKAKIGKVVVAIADPFTQVSGKGIQQLRNAGIEVEVGLCAEQAAQLNAPFIKHAQTGRSWVILKWAQSTDGKMAWTDKSKQRWISNEQSREDVHKFRRRVQAILVGINTVIDDDPLLTARPGKPTPLTRIVLDSHLRIPLKSQLLQTALKSPVIIATSNHAVEKNKDMAKAIEQKGAELLIVPLKNNSLDLQYLIQQLGGRDIAQLLVEGGPTVLSSFLKAKLADEVIVYISDETLGQKGSIEITPQMRQFTKDISPDNTETKHFGNNIRISQIINNNNSS